MAVESRLPPETRDRTDRTDFPIENEDVYPVRTRVSWSAILAGVALSLAMYFLLSLLGGAVGLSISDKVSADSLSTGAVVFAVVVTCVSLFVGGYVASQLTVGENRLEGVLYGILVWAGTFGMLVYLMSAGVRMGYNAMMGVANVAGETTTQAQWEDAARRAGVPPERIEEWRRTAQNAPAEARAAAQDPANRQAAANAATRVAWYSFFGAWVSMAVAAFGGWCGTGPVFRFVRVPGGAVRAATA